MFLSQLVFRGSIALVAGIFLASFVFIPLSVVLIIFVVGIGILCVFWKQKKVAFVGFCIFLVALGMQRVSFVLEKIPKGDEVREVSFLAKVIKEPYQEGSYARVIVDPEGDIHGNALLYVMGYTKLNQGDSVLVKGKLETPTQFSDFDYRMFLAKDGIFYTMFSPVISIQKHGFSVFEKLRQVFRNATNKNIPAPESFVQNAMFLGDATLPENMKVELNVTGTRHIIAISGMHIALFATMIGTLLLGVGMFRRQAYMATIVFVILYLFLTGFQASAVRSGIMGGAFFFGGMLGRRNDSFRMLVLACCIMLLLSPLAGRYDAGFQLSFLAVLGISLFFPFLEKKLQVLPSVFGMREIVAMTIAAQVFTFPVLVLSFQSFSLISLFPNLLIIPMLPPLFVVGTIFFVGSALFPFLGGILAVVPSVLLSVLLFVVHIFSLVPFASVQVSAFFVFFFAFCSVVLGFFAYHSQQKERFPFKEV